LRFHDYIIIVETLVDVVSEKSGAEGFRLLEAVPRNVLVLILTLALNNLGISYLMIVITAYLPEVGVATHTIGLLIGVEGLTMALSAVPFGLLSDKWGRKWIIIGAILGATPLFFIVAFTTNTSLLLMGGAFAGILEGAYLATVNALIADQTNLVNRDSAFTLSFILVGGASSIGSALPVLIPFLSHVIGVGSGAVHSDLLIFFGVLSMLSPLALYLALRGYHETPSSGEGLLKGEGMRRILKFSLVNSMIGFGAGFIMPLIPTWLYLRFALPDTVSGPLLAVSSLTIGLAAAFSPRLARKVGTVRAITVTEGLSVLFMVSLAYINDVGLALGVYVVRSMLMNMASPLADSFLMSIVEPGERGLASSINSVIWRIPNSVTTIIGGAILASGDYYLPFLLAGGFYAVGVPLFYLAFRDTKAHE
jgi:MFS family permease